MGWSYGYPTKEALLEFLTNQGDFINSDGEHVWNNVLKFSIRGNCVWCIIVSGDYENDNPVEREKQIVLYVIGKKNGTYGYNTYVENQYPNYSSCPVRFFLEVPTDDKMIIEWRKWVFKQNHLKKDKANFRELYIEASNDFSDLVVYVENCIHPYFYVRYRDGDKTMYGITSKESSQLFRVPKKSIVFWELLQRHLPERNVKDRALSLKEDHKYNLCV